MEPADRDRLRQACVDGGSSLHGTGLNPGNLGAVVPLALTGMSRSVEHVTVQERADWSVYDSTEITFGQMKFGSPIDEVDAHTDGLSFTSQLFFQEQVWLLGDALNLGVDEVTTELEVIPASADRDVCGRTLRAGTVAAQRWQWTGLCKGVPVVEVETLWTVGEPQPTYWPAPPARVDRHHRRNSVDAGASDDACQFSSRRSTGRACSVSQCGDRDAGGERCRCGVRRRCWFRHDGGSAAESLSRSSLKKIGRHAVSEVQLVDGGAANCAHTGSHG